jgi:hypothetical protein
VDEGVIEGVGEVSGGGAESDEEDTADEQEIESDGEEQGIDAESGAG